MKTNLKKLTKGINMVEFNNIINIDDELILVQGNDFIMIKDLYTIDKFNKSNISDDNKYTDISEEHKDIELYFIIDELEGDNISKITGFPLYYSKVCNLYIIGIDTLDKWHNIEFNI